MHPLGYASLTPSISTIHLASLPGGIFSQLPISKIQVRCDCDIPGLGITNWDSVASQSRST